MDGLLLGYVDRWMMVYEGYLPFYGREVHAPTMRLHESFTQLKGISTRLGWIPPYRVEEMKSKHSRELWQLIFWLRSRATAGRRAIYRQIILTALPAMVTIIPSSSYIIPSSSSFHPPPSLALFLWFNNNRSSHKKIGRIRRHHHHHHHHERRLPFSLTLSAATTPSLPSQPGGGGKGELYNDNELLELLLLHQSISTTNSFTTDNDARVDVVADITISGETEEGSPTTDSLGGIHDWVLQALENDIGIYNDDHGTNNKNDNSDFDYINGSDNNIIIEDETEEGPPLMSTVVHDWILQAIRFTHDNFFRCHRRRRRRRKR